MTQPQTNEQLAQSLGAVAGNVNQMRTGLSSGELVIDRQSGEALVAAMTDAIDGSVRVSNRLSAVSTPANLGTNLVSSAMTRKFSGRADGEQTALSILLQQHQQLLTEARDAISTSLQGFAATDGSITADLHGN